MVLKFEVSIKVVSDMAGLDVRSKSRLALMSNCMSFST